MSGNEYQAALDYVLSFADYERMSRSAIVFDLSRMEALLERLGDPHLAAKSVHIAGTKGKGSTSAMIASVLTASGYRTGLYTSPHLHTMRERIQVDGRLIEEKEFADLVNRLRPEIETVNRLKIAGELTTFEVLSALAFVYFRENNVDFQVLETGLGGRLDATNLVEPAVCAITSISLDHTEVLGDTLAKIATEKAGIIKPGCPVVCAPQHPEASAVIAGVCQQKGAILTTVGKDVTWQIKESSYSGQSFRLNGLREEYDLSIPLLGEYQLDNAAIAVASLEVLANSGTRITPTSIAEGLSQVYWPGRLQVLQHNPLFIVDGAHNADSASKLRQALKRYFEFDDIVLIVGTSRDKNVAGIVAELANLSDNIIVTHSNNPRAATTSMLAAEFSKWGKTPLTTEAVAGAVDVALAKTKPGDLICATGSLFVVSEVIGYLKGLDPEHYST
jgi:dihydrofolate synthase/folylpolyglutamate synthase